MDSRNPRFYQWSEDQGGRRATEIGSALFHHLNPLNLADKTMLRLFCDGCGRNKNEYPENIKEIYLTFPVRDYSLLPADRVFGRIEKTVTTVPLITFYKRYGVVLLLEKDWGLNDVIFGNVLCVKNSKE